MDEIRIHGLLLDCIVGIHAHERVNEQPLRVDLKLTLDTRAAARSGRISQTIHYGDVAEQVTAMLRFRRYRLLEVAAEEVALMLLGVHARLHQVSLRLQKPRALEGLAQAASLQIRRTRADLTPAGFGLGAVASAGVVPAGVASAGAASGGATATAHSGVEMVSLLSTREAELAVATLSPRQRWLGTHAPERRCLTWVLSGELHSDTHRLRAGQWHVCEPSRHLAWVNGETEARVFRCEAWGEASPTVP